MARGRRRVARLRGVAAVVGALALASLLLGAAGVSARRRGGRREREGQEEGERRRQVLEVNAESALLATASGAGGGDFYVSALGSQGEAWFVEWYAPWDATSKDLMAVWETVMSEEAQAHGKEKDGQEQGRGSTGPALRVAKVNFHKNKRLNAHFNVSRTRTILYLSDGEMAEYRGRRDAASILEYVKTGFANDPSKRPIPPPMTLIHALVTLAASLGTPAVYADFFSKLSWDSLHPREIVQLMRATDSATLFLVSSGIFVLITIFLIFGLGRSIENAPFHYEAVDMERRKKRDLETEARSKARQRTQQLRQSKITPSVAESKAAHDETTQDNQRSLSKSARRRRRRRRGSSSAANDHERK